MLSSTEDESYTRLYNDAYELVKGSDVPAGGSRPMKDDKSLIANYTVSKNPNWTVISLIRDHEMIQEQYNARNTIVIVTSAIFLLLLVTSIVVSKRYYLPMMVIFSQIVKSARKAHMPAAMEAVNLKVIVNATKSLFERMNALEHQEEKSIFALQSHYLQLLLQQSDYMNDGEIRGRLLELKVVDNKHDAFLILVLRVNDYARFTRNNTKKSISLKLNSLGNITLEMLGYEGNGTYLIMDDDHLVFLLQTGEYAELSDAARMEKVLVQLRETSQSIWDIDFTAGVSETEGNYENIANCYKQAYEVTNYRLYYGRDSVLFSSAVMLESEIIVEAIRKTEKQLTKDIKQLAREEYDRHVQQYLELLRALPYRTTVKLNAQMIVSLLSILENVIFEQSVKPEYVYETISRQLIAINSSGTSDMMKKIVELTEQNYADPGISANGISDELSITPQYFSKLAKEAMGMSFPDYLNHLRLNKARELLATRPDLGIKDIYQSVGYNNAAYFTTLFKKTYGVTPTNYRKTLK